MKLKLLACAIVAGTALVHSSAFAQSTTNKGSTPNGKPFTYLNAQIQTSATAIAALQATVSNLQVQINAANTGITTLEATVAMNSQKIAALQASQSATNAALQTLRNDVSSQIAALYTDIAGLNQQIAGLQAQVNNLTATLTQQLAQLQLAVTNNSENISALTVQISTLTAQLLLVDTQVDNHEGRLDALELLVAALNEAVIDLDTRLVGVEQSGPGNACFTLNNTTDEDITNNDWFDACVAAAQSGKTKIHVIFKNGDGSVAYDAVGPIVGSWTQDNLTSTTSDVWSQYNSYNHDRMITLNNGDKLMLSGKSSANAGCGGDLGNGYGMVIYPSNPDYYSNIKFLVQPYQHFVGYSGARYFSPWDAGREISWNNGSTLNTCSWGGSSGQAFIGSLQIIME
ncbi:MAG: hypothetical protein V4603_15885 [Pseudomonadota bacterium]